MTTAMLERRVERLENEMRQFRSALAHAVPTPAKKVPAWLAASLRDVEEGRVSGPFKTVKELMADLRSPGA